jgi:hypothetical protein
MNCAIAAPQGPLFSECGFGKSLVPYDKISSVYLKSIKKNGAGVNPNSVSNLAGSYYSYLKY